MALGSAAKLIGQLEEGNDEMRMKTLEDIHNVVDVLWPEISLLVEKIEKWAANSSFKGMKMASLVASKVHYYSGSEDDALIFALDAQQHINLEDQSDYVVAITTHAFSIYSALQNGRLENVTKFKSQDVLTRLTSFINTAFECFIRNKCYYHAVGMAVDTRRTDIFKRILTQRTTGQDSRFISYCIDVVVEFAPTVVTKKEMLLAIVKKLGANETIDYVCLSRALKHLEDPKCLFDFLVRFATSSDQLAVVAYQLAIDVHSGAPLAFLQKVGRMINKYAKERFKLASLRNSVESRQRWFSYLRMEASKRIHRRQFPEIANENDRKIAERFYYLDRIFRGYLHVWLYGDFHSKNCWIDLDAYAMISEYSAGSIGCSAAAIASGLMGYGTGLDSVTRTDSKWMGNAKYWSSFTSVASLGATYHNHDEKAMKKINEYLPKEALRITAEYLQGGAYYALGLAYAHRSLVNIINYLIFQLHKYDVPIIRHGACLGIGLAAMGTHHPKIYTILKEMVEENNAVVGLAASLSMGLVMASSNNVRCVMELASIGAQTRHEKVLHGICVAIAAISLGHAEEAEIWIRKLSERAEPFLRMASVYGLAMAYCGSGNTAVTNRLLEFSVSDTNENIRRVAITCIGFVMARRPDHCIQLVSRMTKSYDPFIRYGSAMALGIACAGTAHKEALQLLHPMIDDETGFVRQGVLMALAMVYMQCNENMEPRVVKFRKILLRAVRDDHEDPLARFGAIIACGILDAAGNTATISIYEGKYYVSTPAAVGLLVFVHMWYWFPLGHFLTLALQPTCLIGINHHLRMPKFKFLSKAAAAQYAVLKTAKLNLQAQGRKLPSIVTNGPAPKQNTSWKRPLGGIEDESVNAEKTCKVEEHRQASSAVEEDSVELPNPARVIRKQLTVMEMPEECRYVPFKYLRFGGIIMMYDEKLSENEELLSLTTVTTDSEDEDEEPKTPDSFEYFP
uniref:26S proteasome non-ATPase regulatory subunit 1 n=1 Tax=Trichuris muris TaxID=70415 RepID=A0A5S6QF14_TRIMR